MQMFIAVAIGGAVGAVLRWQVGLQLNRYDFPWGTFVVNVVGSFIIGAVFAHTINRPLLPHIQIGIMTGLLGGFTTFSAFSLEVAKMLEFGQLKNALVYVVASVVVSILAAFAGMSITKLL